jgi:hypothetical protein
MIRAITQESLEIAKQIFGLHYLIKSVIDESQNPGIYQKIINEKINALGLNLKKKQIMDSKEKWITALELILEKATQHQLEVQKMTMPEKIAYFETIKDQLKSAFKIVNEFEGDKLENIFIAIVEEKYHIVQKIISDWKQSLTKDIRELNNLVPSNGHIFLGANYGHIMALTLNHQMLVAMEDEKNELSGKTFKKSPPIVQTVSIETDSLCHTILTETVAKFLGLKRPRVDR